MSGANCDLLVVGGGINGAGVARDAVGRGLSVVLVEAGDLAAATSSASSKLIHGGLRYLEQYEFRLVAEALAEREILLRVAAHLTTPLRFVMPHVPELRPRWMIRVGLFLYDHLARRSLLPASRRVRLDASPYGDGLRPELHHGFEYSDCWVDDARLVIANAVDAAERVAHIRVRTELLSARRSDGRWSARLSDGTEISARAILNASGPWVKRVLNERLRQPSADSVRLVKGSHIVVPRVYQGEHAFILQNDDRRVVFMIPFEQRFTLIGTTDVAIDDENAAVEASADEVAYLCRAANRYLARPIGPADVIWRYAGVRPLYDDGTSDPSAVTRDYTLRLDDEGGAAVLSVFGGKITTYRRLAEHALERLAPYFPGMRGPWTSATPLPGSDFAASPQQAFAELQRAFPQLGEEVLRGVFRRHGTRARDVLGDGKVGEHYGGGLTGRELRYFVDREWAMSADDVLWRRSKAGLHLDAAQRERVARAVEGLRGA